LPIRVPVAAGESLDSWLEALARRNGINVHALAAALGWPKKLVSVYDWLRVPGPQLAMTEELCGLHPGRLAAAVPGRYEPLMPVRIRGSRYCPRCLAESGGRWQLLWRLPWVFACITHQVLLNDLCPVCGKPPRSRISDAGLNPAGSCHLRTGTREFCHADLSAVASLPLPGPEGILLSAQRWVCGHLDSADQNTAARAVTDMAVAATWILGRCSRRDIARFGKAATDAWQPRAPHIAGALTHLSAALAGAGAAMAIEVTAGEEAVAMERLRTLTEGAQRGFEPRPPGMTTRSWNLVSAPAQGRFLRAMDGAFHPVHRIRCRTGTVLAAVPSESTAVLQARARQIPQLLWPGWAIRLAPQGAWKEDRGFRVVAAACLMLPGNPARQLADALPDPYHRNRATLYNGLHALAAEGHEPVFAAFCCLADYLDQHGSPIDYELRRDLAAAWTITETEWREICADADVHPGKGRRLTDARRYAYQLITGADLTDRRHRLAPRTARDSRRYAAFSDVMSSPLRDALHGHARRLLAGAGIDEPLTWEPPSSVCAHLTLPGVDPAGIDLGQVSELVGEGVALGEAARRLGTSIDHIRYTLDLIHRPASAYGPCIPLAARRTRMRADQTLTRDFLQQNRVRDRKTFEQLQAETGIGRHLISAYARRAGIVTRRVTDAAPISKEWLASRHLHDNIPLAQIAAEMGVNKGVVYGAAHRHGMQVRPAGVHSTVAMTARLPRSVPRDLRAAVEGTIGGWERLHRFRAAMAFPTFKAAAISMGADQSGLIHQFRRLEHDVGASLYVRAHAGRPMHPTRRGAALIKALDAAQASADANLRGAPGSRRERRAASAVRNGHPAAGKPLRQGQQASAAAPHLGRPQSQTRSSHG
jgi:hypothetical protein